MFKRKKRRKRKVERRLKRKFEETTIGLGIKLHAPLEYEMIVSAGGYEPSAELIETISYASMNPYFRGIYFRKNLIAYRRNGGCYQEHRAKAKEVRDKSAYLRRRINMLR